MKVERKEVKVFVPVVITLETQEEAGMMYDMLNCGEGMPLNKHNPAAPFPVKTEMWHKFNEIYRR